MLLLTKKFRRSSFRDLPLYYANNVTVEKYTLPNIHNYKDSAQNIQIWKSMPVQFFDLRKSRLYICKMHNRSSRRYISGLSEKKKGSSTCIPEHASPLYHCSGRRCTPINYYMNGKLVSLNTIYYPWKTHRTLLLSSGQEASDAQLLQSNALYLEMQIWYKTK